MFRGKSIQKTKANNNDDDDDDDREMPASQCQLGGRIILDLI